MTPREKIEEMADQLQSELILIEGYDDCIIGVAQQYDRVFVVYDQDKMVEKMVAGGMSWEDARELHAVKQATSWMGDGTPAFMWALSSVRARIYDA